MVFRHPRDKGADFYARTAVQKQPEVRVCVGEYHPDVFKRCHVDIIFGRVCECDFAKIQAGNSYFYLVSAWEFRYNIVRRTQDKERQGR